MNIMIWILSSGKGLSGLEHILPRIAKRIDGARDRAQNARGAAMQLSRLPAYFQDSLQNR